MRSINEIRNGQRFGRLIVLHETSVSYTRLRYWFCRCACGNEKPIRGTSLVKGLILSCGCYKQERAKQFHTRHGNYKSAEYKIWLQMRQRCSNSQNAAYYRYGGRGIKVCERWDVFENFIADMGLKPSLNHSIDRINNDGNYEPSNCRWATMKEQANNTRTNHLILFRDETKTLTEWCEYLGISRVRVDGRLRAGWSAEDAFTKPFIPHQERWKYSGQQYPGQKL